MKILIFSLLAFFNRASCQLNVSFAVTNNSRNSCIKIISKSTQSSGTGFFIGNDIIVTCFHVISQPFIDSNQRVVLNIFNDLQAINENGDTIPLTCISIPTASSPEPLLEDFALLKTSSPYKNKSFLALSKDTIQNIGDNIVFSGYPLGTPTMVSHFGTISGITKDNSLICVQASTNKGNSGGALIEKNGTVIGIISMREGGISLGLQEYLKQIKESENAGSVQIMGIDPLQVTKETIRVLDKYISTGIGYARNIKFLRAYIQKHKIKI